MRRLGSGRKLWNLQFVSTGRRRIQRMYRIGWIVEDERYRLVRDVKIVLSPVESDHIAVIAELWQCYQKARAGVSCK